MPVRPSSAAGHPDPAGVAVFLLSGGTTGLPKLIARTHNDYSYNARASARLCRLGEGTVYLVSLPASHNFPLACPGILGTLLSGGRVVMLGSPDPASAFAAIEREGVTITAVVPAVAQRWLAHAAELGNRGVGAGALRTLEVLQVGGARLADEHAARIKPVLGATLQQVFGMAEGLLNYTRLDDPDEVICGTQGRPLSPGDEVRIVDADGNDLPDGQPGALLTRGPYTPRGYYRAPEQNARAFTPDGWYASGDVVRRRPDGNLVVEGRDKDMINRGGEKISAEEVENLLYRMPGIAQVAAVAAPDAELGERICVFVVPEPGGGHHPGRDQGWHGDGRGSQVQVAGTAGDRGRVARDQDGQAGQEGAARLAREEHIMTDIETRPANDFDSTEHQARLKELYRDFEAAGMTPLWLTREGLMPFHPQPRAVPHLWRWADLLPLAARSAELVPVGRGGERRAISLGNPGLTGDPYTTPTLWAAIQYLAPREDAPEHRHTQSAFRFVLEGEGVWTVVDGDPVAMRRGDLLLTPGWAFHGHQNVSDVPMAWLDGLDIPLVAETDQGFFEFGPDQVRNRATPDRSASERLWGQPGLTPVALAGTRPASPLVAYRWAHTDAALAAQLELEAEGVPGALEPGHAAVRYTNPTSGGDALTTMRTEFHRLAAGAATRRSRTSASSVWQVFDGTGSVRLNDEEHPLERGDIVAVPAWTEFSLTAAAQLDLFTFSDAPVFEKLNLLRTEVS